MTGTPSSPPNRADVDAALLLLSRMGISPADLVDAAPALPPAPTFTEYIPTVSSAVSDGTRRVYGSYWSRITEHWGHRRLDEPTPTEIKSLVETIRANVVLRRNARGGRSAAEHLIAALRCVYRHAIADGLIDEADNPARKVDKPRRLPSTRRAFADVRLAKINQIAATTGDDPALDCGVTCLARNDSQVPAAVAVCLATGWATASCDSALPRRVVNSGSVPAGRLALSQPVRTPTV